jgi:hypothetical protein
MHLDQLFPFVGTLAVAQVHDGTIQPFIEHEQARGLAPKSINNALGVVSTVLNRAAGVWRSDTDTDSGRKDPTICRKSVGK